MPVSTLSPPARLRRSLAGLAAGLALALVAVPAYAHDELKSSNPADGATLSTPPASVVLTFNEAPVSLGAQLVVTGPDGARSKAAPRITGKDVVQDMRPGAPAGRYTVEWRVTSVDGHPISGSFAFTASAAAAGASPSAAPASPTAASPTAASPTAASPTPAPADAARRDPLIPSWAWIVAGVIVVAAAIRINLRARAKARED